MRSRRLNVALVRTLDDSQPAVARAFVRQHKLWRERERERERETERDSVYIELIFKIY